MFELPPPVLSAHGLGHAYRGRVVLQGCDIALYPGECLAIVGPSGSGKSTLLSLLAGRLPLAEGADYRLGGHDLRDPALRRAHLRRLTGYVAQQAATVLDLRLSAAANIVRPLLDLGRRDAKGALAEARCWMERLGLEAERLADPVGQFSGGMQQRVQIAAALVHHPQVLFLDEPTTGLDSVAQSDLVDVLRGLKADAAAAMLFVTHDLAIARLLADRVVVMDRGRIVEEAVFDRLLAAPQSRTGAALVRAMP